MLVGLKSLACIEFPTIAWHFVSTHLVMAGEYWSVIRKTAQTELPKENNSNFKCSHFKVKCLVSIGSYAQHIYSTFLLLIN